MNVSIVIDGDGAADELRSLQSSLREAPQLRGRSRLIQGPPVPGTLGTGVQEILLVLQQGGSVAALASVLITWLRVRGSRMQVEASHKDNEISIKVTVDKKARISGAEAAQLLAGVERILTAADGDAKLDDERRSSAG